MTQLTQTSEMELFLHSQQCPEREKDGTGQQCELPADHNGPHACPIALKNFLKSRYPGQYC
jgi:hypothetical protein